MFSFSLFLPYHNNQKKIYRPVKRAEKGQQEGWKKYIDETICSANYWEIDNAIQDIADRNTLTAEEKHELSYLCFKLGQFYTFKLESKYAPDVRLECAKEFLTMSLEMCINQEFRAWALNYLAWGYLQVHLLDSMLTKKTPRSIAYCDTVIQAYSNLEKEEDLRLLMFAHFIKAICLTGTVEATKNFHLAYYYENQFKISGKLFDTEYVEIKLQHAALLTYQKTQGTFEHPLTIFESLEKDYWSLQTSLEKDPQAARFYYYYARYLSERLCFSLGLEKYKIAYRIQLNTTPDHHLTKIMLQEITELQKMVSAKILAPTLKKELIEEKKLPVKEKEKLLSTTNMTYGTETSIPAETEEDEKIAEPIPAQRIY